MPIREFTKPLERSPCYESNRSSARQEFSHTLWNPEVNYRFHKAYPNQVNVVHKFSFSTLNFTLILSQSSISRSSNWSLSSRIHHKNLVYISLLPHLIHLPRPSHPHCLHRHNIRGGVRTKKPLVAQFDAFPPYFILRPYLFWSALTSNTHNVF